VVRSFLVLVRSSCGLFAVLRPDFQALDASISLLEEERTLRNGTGETCRTLSWIWTTESRTPNDDDETDDILRSEWAKSRACANRCKEEVLLLREEMRRTLVFLEWKSEWWLQQQGLREGLPRELDEGLRVFALGQANLQQRLAAHFQAIWKGSLEESIENSSHEGNFKNDVENPENDTEDDDDDEDEDNNYDNDDEHEGDLGQGEDIEDDE